MWHATGRLSRRSDQLCQMVKLGGVKNEYFEMRERLVSVKEGNHIVVKRQKLKSERDLD